MTDDSFRQIALAELDAVYRLARHLSHTPAEAEDCVQETYLRAIRAAGTFTPGPHGIRPWLFKILHNVIHTSGARVQRDRSLVDGLRQLNPGGAAATDDGPNGPSGPVAGDGAAVDWDHVDERLKAAVADLPLAHQAVFLLSAIEGLKYREIADVVDVPVGTVMSRLSRARAMLAARLAGLGHELGFKLPQGTKDAD